MNVCFPFIFFLLLMVPKGDLMLCLSCARWSASPNHPWYRIIIALPDIHIHHRVYNCYPPPISLQLNPSACVCSRRWFLPCESTSVPYKETITILQMLNLPPWRLVNRETNSLSRWNMQTCTKYASRPRTVAYITLNHFKIATMPQLYFTCLWPSNNQRWS